MPHNARTLMLVPVGAGVGMTSVSLGLIRALERNRLEVQFFKPVTEPSPNGATERTTEILRHNVNLESPTPFSAQYAETQVSTGKMPELLEEILARYQSGSSQAEVIVVEGILPSSNSQFSNQLNHQIAKALDAEVVLVTCPPSGVTKQLKERLEFAVRSFGGGDSNRVVGCIINKIGAPLHHSDTPGAHAGMPTQGEALQDSASSITKEALYRQVPLRIVGCIPWNADLLAPRALDLARHFDAQIINRGELETRRLHSVTFCSRSLANMLRRFTPGAMLVTSADRPDVVAGACLAVMNGVKIGCLLLTGGYQLDRALFKVCTPAMETGLPVLLVGANTWRTVMELQTFNLRTPADDRERVNRVQDFFASHLDENWVRSLSQVSSRPRRMSPSAFRYHLTELAHRSPKRIALPEGEEPRTIKAALICSERGIAQTILLGNAKTIQRVAEQQGLRLSDQVQIVNPAEVRDHYVEPMVTLRRKKGLTQVVAQEQLRDNVVLGTMMLALDEVDGLVSGAIHTTANTIRPALQLIKAAPGEPLVSSIFFMLLPEQVLVYGDCAINPDPNAEQLAAIAIQSADSAAAFGIEPRVAMISYSTGTSGSGSDVDKVREATRIARQQRPKLIIDGPLQYDAALIKTVAAQKAPHSPVAGRATVFIFPDLNTGNTTYKAVQRSADLVSIGPMLQGLRKPVNDLSRGALVDDIVYTIALTAIQAQQRHQ
ncbi:phosphate acetyltransferase [Microbulbifer sp. 2205BS26-8]|uniref:phosphate acetyltransferase n=1 Tax=Microbulbifer sp. 2205BS26-8 TaxID=3064386 RepID=UPI00273DE8C3|nr:phosphate acetyltransferase [Microbulbifer sp. 2205BS26-8]MDP5208291.1 phosphate acetyltransferase [Microbulbifer sp. 2205BS26-8]